MFRRLHKVLRPFLLRCLKDVKNELPDKMAKVIKIRIGALQTQLYKQTKKRRRMQMVKIVKGTRLLYLQR